MIEKQKCVAGCNTHGHPETDVNVYFVSKIENVTGIKGLIFHKKVFKLG